MSFKPFKSISEKAGLSRREFINRLVQGSLSASGLYHSMGTLGMTEALTNYRHFNDYKAMVCIFLAGGNDAFNMLTPTSTDEYNIYRQSRQTLAVAREELLPINPQSHADSTYGFHPSMGAVQQLFESGNLAAVANVGSLIEPTTRQTFIDRRVQLPPQLFSHSDQQDFWKSLQTQTNNKTGWAGRASDLLATAEQLVPINFSLSGSNLWQRGIENAAYGVSPFGFNLVYGIDEQDPQLQRRTQVFNQILQAADSHQFEREFSRVQNRSMSLSRLLKAAIELSPSLNVEFGEDSLGASLKMVSNVIQARDRLASQRQIFFIVMGGFDTHGRQAIEHPQLLQSLSDNLKSFYDATVEMGVASQVTTFTQAEFGRTLTVNGDGTDHGWGSHHLVMGGSVIGQDIYGQMPDLTIGGPDDTFGGRIIPTLSVDQYAATLTRWFGLAESELDDVFPNLANFSTKDLGFMQS